MKLNRSQNPGGHKEGRASFPIKSQYNNLNNPYLYFLERRREEEERGRKRRQGGGGCLWVPGPKRERERERERGYLIPTTLNQKD